MCFYANMNLMLYAQLKKVLEIDNRITTLHQELAHLYDERSKFVATAPGTSTSSINTSSSYQQGATAGQYDPWIQQAYAKLASAWDVYNIDIPEQAKLEAKLIHARKILAGIEAVDQKLAKNMQIILVPPKRLLSFPASINMREKQPHIEKADYVNPALLHKHQTPSNSWRMLVVLTSPSGLNYGSAGAILKEKKYRLCGLDARALGVYEYTALTLQCNRAIDQNVWTILLKNTESADASLITSVKLVGKQYRFELDEAGGAFGDERFRPAIEVKA